MDRSPSSDGARIFPDQHWKATNLSSRLVLFLGRFRRNKNTTYFKSYLGVKSVDMKANGDERKLAYGMILEFPMCSKNVRLRAEKAQQRKISVEFNIV